MIPILYGSQTGTARHVGGLIKRAIDHGYNAQTIYDLDRFFCSRVQKERSFLMEMDTFDIEKIFDVNFVIFVGSTHGDGTEPFNMSKFWSFLSKDCLPPGILAHLKFAVFGLGDSSYEKFGYCAKRLFNRLRMLGAEPVVRRGSGDSQDEDGFLTDLRPWVAELVDFIERHKPTNTDAAVFEVGSTTYPARLVAKNVLTPDNHTQCIVELVFDIPDYTDFSPGDCLSFLPTNYNYREFVRYNGMEESEASLVDMVRNRADFNSCPHQPFFFALKYFLELKDTEEEIVSKVGEIAEDYDFYYEYVLKPKRTIFEVLKDLRVRINAQFINDFVPEMYPRFFSATRKGNLYHITVAIVRYSTTLKEPRRSICSEYFLGLSVQDTLRIGVGKSSLYFNSSKLLFICTGVGITLPRACVNMFRDKEMVIFYGFRDRNKDFLYPDEWGRENVKLYMAASRGDGMYVQDVFRKNPVENIDEYLVFVSGNSRLNKEVRRLFQEIYGRSVVFQSETW